jgi:hypothetical protein
MQTYGAMVIDNGGSTEISVEYTLGTAQYYGLITDVNIIIPMLQIVN